MRKNLKMSPGKLAAQVGHCAEAYWMQLLRTGSHDIIDGSDDDLIKIRLNEELGLVEGKDFGLIFDNCYTELEPEEPDGTTLTGIWFAPLPDDVSHSISKKFHLYM